MAMRESKGNMYKFVTHTWNAIKGKCPHDCKYCYMKRFPQKAVRLDGKEFKTDLGEGNFCFVGSSCDMFAEAIPKEWIFETLAHCVKHSKNKYLFQSKNPRRMYALKDYIPHDSIIGTTIETNRRYPEMGNAIDPEERAFFMNQLAGVRGFKTMVTIEPIMDFDVNELVSLIVKCKPDWVNIGADSKGHNLQEPKAEKILELVTELQKFTEVKLKDNLKRIGGDTNELP